jgi:hypothetical protein
LENAEANFNEATSLDELLKLKVEGGESLYEALNIQRLPIT